jgi:ABC-type dipeptide/oligopeptide/nickel transport system permease subunit
MSALSPARRPLPIRVPRVLAQLAGELRRDSLGLVAVGVVLLFVAVAVLAPVLAPHDPNATDIVNRLRPPTGFEKAAPDHLLGTDSLGRDILSRVIHGARASLTVAVLVALVAGSIGTLLGVIAGYRGGRVDQIISRVTDVQTAFPGLLLALVILTMLGPSVTNLVISFSVNGWMVYARTARGQVLSLREQAFIEAAVSIGCRDRTIVFRHLLPNLASSFLTLATLELARIILAESALSYLGMGVQPPEVSWGLMIADGETYMTTSPWLIVVPGTAVAILVLAVNVVASWLRTVADPVQRSREAIKGA